MGRGHALATRSVRHADAGTADAEAARLLAADACEAGVALSYAPAGSSTRVRDIESQRAGAFGRAPAPGHGARRRRGVGALRGSSSGRTRPEERVRPCRLLLLDVRHPFFDISSVLRR